MSSGQILEDIFQVLEIDPDGKKFDKVSRIKGRSDLYEMDLLLDVNVDIFPIVMGDKLVVCLARTLNVDGTPSSTSYDASMMSNRPTLLDRYDYAMHGRVFKLVHGAGAESTARAETYISFGGLLMHLAADPRRLEEIDVDDDVFLLIRKA